MPIYEYYCSDNHRIYQFYAKTLAQGQIVPKCPDNPGFRMEKIVSAFSVVGARKEVESKGAGGDSPDDARLEAAMGAMESEFSNVDENDPRAMGRMMRRMAELSGEPIDPQMDEVVRKLEEGADPDSLEEQLGADEPPESVADQGPENQVKEIRSKLKSLRRNAPLRDPKLYDYV
jgi:hypothetical protein